MNIVCVPNLRTIRRMQYPEHAHQIEPPASGIPSALAPRTLPCPSLEGHLHDPVAVGQALLDVLQQQAAVALQVVLPQQLQHRLPVAQVVRRLELVLPLRRHHYLRVARQRLRLQPLPAVDIPFCVEILAM